MLQRNGFHRFTRSLKLYFDEVRFSGHVRDTKIRWVLIFWIFLISAGATLRLEHSVCGNRVALGGSFSYMNSGAATRLVAGGQPTLTLLRQA